MEELNYTITDSTLARILGTENFSTKESAVLEIVKNAYDAKSKTLEIIYNDGQLLFIDQGKGMDENDIRKHWMSVGTSDKGYSDDSDGEQRVLSGSKGIGRFALARLGNKVTVYSKKSKKATIKWETNWNKNILSKAEIDILDGTKIIISDLRDKWTENAFKNLTNYLSITYNDSQMQITIDSGKNKYSVKRFYSTSKLGINYLTKIKLNYDADEMQLKCDIKSGEFQKEAKEYYDKSSLEKYICYTDIFKELSNDKDLDIDDVELTDNLKKLGSFDGELYFSLKSCTQEDKDNFLYKYLILQDRFDTGVILYRNSFSVSSFEGTKDWLELGKRARKSPAAATHPTGSWRVRENQLSGFITIDKVKNKVIKDLSNRQSLDEDIFFKIFVRIIDIGLKNFERYRQDIIRCINKKNKNNDKEPNVGFIRSILHDPNSLKTLSAEDEKKLLLEIGKLNDSSSFYKEKQEETENRYKYDVRILNVFASNGLRAISIAHELKNDRNTINNNYGDIVKSLIKFGFWGSLNSSEFTKYACNNVPELLSNNKKVNDKMLIFMDTMLDESEKRNFLPTDLNISNEMEKIKQRWENGYSFISIILDIEADMIFYLPEDVLTVIFDNLILNSIQQNENLNKININIVCIKRDRLLNFSYKDNGVGLCPKYIDNPMRILEVHETSRKEGHGLGMWIVNNTLEMTGGEVISIDGHYGFSIEFEIGDKL